MQNQNWATLPLGSGQADASKSEYSLVYYYLLAGIALVVSVFLFLPKIMR